MTARRLLRTVSLARALAVLVPTGLAVTSCVASSRSTTATPGTRDRIVSRSPTPAERMYTSDSLYVEADGAGPAVVFVHAFSMDRRMWAGEIAALGSSSRAIRYDQRGHGLTPVARQSYRSVDDLRSVLDAVHEQRAAIVGLSSGAQIAIDFALTYPERVSRLVLASPGISGFVPRSRPAWMSTVVKAMKSGDAERTAQAWADTPLMHVDRAEGSAAIRTMALANAGIWHQSQNLERPVDHVALGRLDELHIPVLVLVGADDVSEANRVADMLVQQVQGAERMTIPDAGHMLNLSAPREFDAALVRFLRSR
jgi:3-oxoadipate enol-lactonase